MKRKMLSVLSLMLCAMFVLGGCAKEETNENEPAQSTSESAQPTAENKIDEQTPTKGEEEMEKTYVEIKVKNMGEIVVELLPEYAPKTVAFFLELVDDKYYNGLTFHRAVKGFMIQGGSPNGDGIGGCGRTVVGEFKSNGFENNLSHTRGVISMARTMVKDSASGQFFIMHADANYLDGEYAAFGRVVSGMEVVDQIAEMPVNGEMLVEQPVIKSVKVLKNYEPEQ